MVETRVLVLAFGLVVVIFCGKGSGMVVVLDHEISARVFRIVIISKS